MRPALAGLAYTSCPSQSMRKTGFGFWSGNLTIARSAVTSVPYRLVKPRSGMRTGQTA